MKIPVGLTYWVGSIKSIYPILVHNSKIFDKIILITNELHEKLPRNIIEKVLSTEQIIFTALDNCDSLWLDYFTKMGPGVISDIPFYYASKFVMDDEFPIYFDTNTVFWNKFFIDDASTFEEGNFYVHKCISHYSRNNYGTYYSGDFCIDKSDKKIRTELRSRITELITKLIKENYHKEKYTLLGPHLLNIYVNSLKLLGLKDSNFRIDEPDYLTCHNGWNTYLATNHSIGLGASNTLFRRAGFNVVRYKIKNSSLSIKLEDL